MKLFIPTIGDKLRLIKPWVFPLYLEHRNQDMIMRVKPTFLQDGRSWYGGGNTTSIMAEFAKGTILRVARIYLRAGKSEWDSITFGVVEAPGDENRIKMNRRTWATEDADVPKDQGQGKFKGGRFWAKLTDVNEIHCELVGD